MRLSVRGAKAFGPLERGLLFRGTLYSLVFLLNVAVFAKSDSHRLRQAVLLIGSYALYISWGAWFAGILLFSTAMNFLLGEWLRRTPTRLALTTGILLNLALLSMFKYLPELATNLPFSSLQRFSHLALPLGISFWTFQAMSYLFDLYRGEELDPSFFEFALYMVFFPIAISGPICRMPDMLPQFHSRQRTSWPQIGNGFTRIATGLLMMQLARLLGQGILSGDGIDRGFDRLAQWSGADVLCLAFGYALQLFFDFAGYSHIAIGAAQALGFTLPENFARPFESTTPSVFWTRWHMSLSFWIRDYVFFPLATLRREIWWRNLALAFSMVVFGLWHKATILFLLWGCYHGALLVLHRQVQQFQRKVNWEPPAILWTPVSWLVTITLVCLGWILFRSNSLAQATQMFAAVVSPSSYTARFLSGSLYGLVLALAVGYATTLLLRDALDRQAAQPLESAPVQSRSIILAPLARYRWYWLSPLWVLAFIIVFLITHGRDAGAAQFMYRRF
jgi:alginate O-acetyltransferase complex protein AlgI